jgi:hypothetical protein
MKQINKRDALKILIKNSIIFDEEQKKALLSSMDNFSDKQVESFGIMLSIEQKKIKESSLGELLKKAEELDKQLK